MGQICRNAGVSLFQRGGTATCTAIERSANYSDNVTEGHSSVTTRPLRNFYSLANQI